MLLELGNMEFADAAKSKLVPTLLEGLLQQYGKVFEWPNELPPHRGRDPALQVSVNSDGGG